MGDCGYESFIFSPLDATEMIFFAFFVVIVGVVTGFGLNQASLKPVAMVMSSLCSAGCAPKCSTTMSRP